MASLDLIRAIVLDFDGLMIETEHAVLRSWRELYASFGIELPLAEWLDTIGTREALFEPAAYLERCLGSSLSWGELDLRRRRRQDELVDALPLLPGVAEVIADARELGMCVGLASSSSREWVGGHLSKRGLTSVFDCIVTRDDVARSKPAPDAYLRALERLRVSASEAVAFEDSENGLEAAKAAGLMCVVVPHDLTQHMCFEAADLRLGSLAELPLAELLARLGLATAS